MGKLFLKFLLFLNVLLILLGVWGLMVDPDQGILILLSGTVSLVLISVILGLIDTTESLKSSIYYHRKELDEIKKLISNSEN
jgi:NADH:ubiquinone oxidoreductase subunit K